MPTPSEKQGKVIAPAKREVLLRLKESVEGGRSRRRGLNLDEQGSVRKAVADICSFYGKSKSWGDQYSILRGLNDNLVDRLDLVDSREKLVFTSALQLSQLPAELQTEIFSRSFSYFDKGGPEERAAFIRGEVTSFRKARGVVPKNAPEDGKQRFFRLSERLYRLSGGLSGARAGAEYVSFIKGCLSSMSRRELVLVQANLCDGLNRFQTLKEEVDLALTTTHQVASGPITSTTKEAAPELLAPRMSTTQPKEVTEEKPKTVQKDEGGELSSQREKGPTQVVPRKSGRQKLSITGRKSWPSSVPDPLEVQGRDSSDDRKWVSRQIKGTRY